MALFYRNVNPSIHYLLLTPLQRVSYVPAKAGYTLDILLDHGRVTYRDKHKLTFTNSIQKDQLGIQLVQQ